MRMETKLKIFTLNCWGIVGISRHRKERFSAIAQHLATSDYDFVFLQEVWSLADFETICRKVQSVLPNSHYFHSGVMGSGVCIFSKASFNDVAMLKFSLNGYAHKLQHGDWFGGKVVGLCRVFYRGLNIHLYVTHLHAEYDRKHDQYLAHRIAQAFELSQFVRLTSETADLTILAGDLNTEPENAAYQIILYNTGLLDAYLEQPNIQVGGDPADGTTCGNPRNSYTSRSELKEMPNGQRIDYVMFKSNLGTSVQCSSCLTSLDKIPGFDSKISFSDHEAVVASLNVFKSMDSRGTQKSIRARISSLEEGIEILQANLAVLKGDRFFYIFMSCLMLCILLITLPFHDVAMPIHGLLIIVRIALSVVLGFSFWMSCIMFRCERNATMAATSGMQLVLRYLLPLDELETKPEDSFPTSSALTYTP